MRLALHHLTLFTEMNLEKSIPDTPVLAYLTGQKAKMFKILTYLGKAHKNLNEKNKFSKISHFKKGVFRTVGCMYRILRRCVKIPHTNDVITPHVDAP